MGFVLHPEDVLAPSSALLRQVPAYPAEPEVPGVSPGRRPPRFPAANVPSMSPDYQRAVCSGSEAPPGVSAALRLFREDVAVLGTTLSGLNRLSERSAPRSGDIGSPPPPRRFDDREVFRDTACRAVRRPPGCSLRLDRPLRVRARAPSPVLPDRDAPPGVPCPYSDISEGIRIIRPRGFSPPRRVALPSALRTR
jgi:hypothetical protein